MLEMLAVTGFVVVCLVATLALVVTLATGSTAMNSRVGSSVHRTAHADNRKAFRVFIALLVVAGVYAIVLFA